LTAPVQDVICLAIPDGIDPQVFLDGHVELREAFFDKLNRLAQAQVWNQWPTRRPKRVDWETIEWLVTDQVDDVQEFQPAHDCAQCRLGNTRAEAFLREHPGRWLAMGNLTYTPIWTKA
jgi:hypothetical protein